MASSVVLVPCKSCKNKVSVSDLRKNKDGIYVCNTCFSHGYLTNASIQDLTPDRFKKIAEAKQEIKKIVKEERIPYYCSNCKFSFTRPVGSMNKGCPYCNREHTVQRRESAADLIKSVEEFL